MMRKFAAVAVAFMAVALMVAPAHAAQLTGGFAISGVFEWLCPGPGDSGVSCPVATATLLDFQTTGGIKTPGAPGPFLVNAASGSFAGLTGSTGSIKDFSYAGSGTPNFPAPPVSAFEIVGGVTVDLNSIDVVVTACSGGSCTITLPNGFNQQLNLGGTITIKMAGFDDTKGVFSFSGGSGGGNFSFSAQNTAVPEPTSMMLLGLGLTGLVLGRRLKK